MATSHESLPARARSSGSLTRLPPVRLPSREELTAAARVAPLLRVARDLAAWAGSAQAVGAGGELSEAGAAAAVAALDLSAEEVRAAWAVATGTGMLAVTGDHAGPGQRIDVLTSGRPDEALDMWCEALRAILAQESLDGLATALYTAGRPVRLDALFEAYAAAVGALTGGADDDASGQHEPAAGAAPQEAAPAFAPGLEPGLELLADLGVVELGEDEDEDEDEAGLTVTLSPIGMWAVRDRLQARGWRVPVLGGSADGGAAAVLAVLADYDAEDGEAEIAAWLGRRSPERAAEELTEAASRGSPGLRGAAFAVLDRVGPRRCLPCAGPWPAPCCARTRRSGCVSTARRSASAARTAPGSWSTSEPACWRRRRPRTWWPNCCPTCRRTPRRSWWPGCGGWITRP